MTTERTVWRCRQTHQYAMKPVSRRRDDWFIVLTEIFSAPSHICRYAQRTYNGGPITAETWWQHYTDDYNDNHHYNHDNFIRHWIDILLSAYSLLRPLVVLDNVAVVRSWTRKLTSCRRAAATICPRPGLQVVTRYTSCTHMDRSPLPYAHVGLPVQPTKAAWWPWPLTFWPWKLCPSHVWRGLPRCQF